MAQEFKVLRLFQAAASKVHIAMMIANHRHTKVMPPRTAAPRPSFALSWDRFANLFSYGLHYN